METNSHIPRIAFSAQEIAKMLASNYGTILAEIRSGKLFGAKVGREYRVHRDILEEYLKAPGSQNQPLTRIAYSAEEVAEMLGSKYETILSEVRAGRIVARRVGKEYRIHRDNIDKYLKCPDHESRPASTWTPKQATGAFSGRTGPAVASDYKVRLLSKLRNKHLLTK